MQKIIPKRSVGGATKKRHGAVSQLNCQTNGIISFITAVTTSSNTLSSTTSTRSHHRHNCHTLWIGLVSNDAGQPTNNDETHL